MSVVDVRRLAVVEITAHRSGEPDYHAKVQALIGSIVAEISTISFSGLGKMLAENSRASDTVALWVIMIYGAVLGIALVGLVGLIERGVTPWRAGRPQ